MEPDRNIPAGEFKAHCLRLLDEVARTGQPIVITKHGRPVARLVAPAALTKTLFGALAGSVLAESDLVAPIDAEWDAARDVPGKADK